MIKVVVYVASIFFVGSLIAQEETDYTKWSFNIRGSYMIQKDVGVNSPTSFFNFQNTFLPSGGINYLVGDKEKFDIWVGVSLLYFAPHSENVLRTAGSEFEVDIQDYQDAILGIPVTFKSDFLSAFGLNEFFTLRYNIPLYRFETITTLSTNNSVIYRTESSAENNFFSTAIGMEKAIYTQPLLFELGIGYSLDLNEFYDGTVELGDGTIQDYTLVTSGPFLNLSLRPKRFKIEKK